MTPGMKTAISLPDQLFKRADRQAQKERISRSALVQRALEAYLRCRADDVTAQIDAALEDLGRDDESTAWVRAASTQALKRRG